jgi:hypothetical protein
MSSTASSLLNIQERKLVGKQVNSHEMHGFCMNLVVHFQNPLAFFHAFHHQWCQSTVDSIEWSSVRRIVLHQVIFNAGHELLGSASKIGKYKS